MQLRTAAAAAAAAASSSSALANHLLAREQPLAGPRDGHSIHFALTDRISSSSRIQFNLCATQIMQHATTSRLAHLGTAASQQQQQQQPPRLAAYRHHL